MSEQQILNYLYWLKERGQAFVTVGEAAPAESAAPAPQPPIPLTLLFLSKYRLKPEEQTMTERIATALGLKSEDFRLATEEEAIRYQPRHVVGLGATSEQIIKDLTIPHPSDMLSDPQLKVSAWTDLQGLKNRIH